MVAIGPTGVHESATPWGQLPRVTNPHGMPRSLMHIPMKPKLKAKSFQWLLENMGGLRVIWYKMGREPDEDDEQKAIDLGFD